MKDRLTQAGYPTFEVGVLTVVTDPLPAWLVAIGDVKGWKEGQSVITPVALIFN